MNSHTKIVGPVDKVKNPSICLSAVTIGVWIAEQRGVKVPADVALAIATVLAFLVGYLTPLKRSEVK